MRQYRTDTTLRPFLSNSQVELKKIFFKYFVACDDLIHIYTYI